MSREFHQLFARRGIFTATLVGIIAMLAAGSARAQTITVNDTSDPGTGSTCTLRDAINLAQGTTPRGTCSESGSGPLTILFNLTGTITLSSTAGPLPVISSPTNLTITGPNPASSAAITISGDDNVGIMLVNGATVNLNYLTFSDGAGQTGGAIFLDPGKLTITDCTFLSNNANSGGAINNNGGTLTITGSTFDENGVSGGGAGGGAIFEARSSTATITNSTFSRNQAEGGDGDAFGGAIENQPGGTLTLVNVTISGNQVGGSGGAFGGSIFNSANASMNLKGTIFADSTPSNCANFGTISDDGYNIADDTDNSCRLNLSPSGTSEIITPDSAIGLAALPANNGGPTFTLALSAVAGGAYNFIPAAGCTDANGNSLTIDQRGDKRPDNGTCSAGAYQYESPIDCSGAYASNPNLTALLPVMFFPEYVFGVNDINGGYNLKITGVTQDKKPTGFPLCPNAFWSGTTTYVRTNNEPLQPGPSGLEYQIQFKATDNATGQSCTAAAPVCVQGLFQSGQPCKAVAASYNATKCP